MLLIAEEPRSAGQRANNARLPRRYRFSHYLSTGTRSQNSVIRNSASQLPYSDAITCQNFVCCMLGDKMILHRLLHS